MNTGQISGEFLKCLNHAVLQNFLKPMLLTEEPCLVTTAAQLTHPTGRKRIPDTRKFEFHGRCSELDFIFVRTSKKGRRRLAAGVSCTWCLTTFVSPPDPERWKVTVGLGWKEFPHGVCTISPAQKGPALSTSGLQVGLSKFPRDVLARKPLVELGFFLARSSGSISSVRRPSLVLSLSLISSYPPFTCQTFTGL